MGKAYSEKVQSVATVKLEAAPKVPIKKGQTDSVSGFVLAFIIVGIDANASLAIAKTMAILGSLVSHHIISAKAESTPHT